MANQEKPSNPRIGTLFHCSTTSSVHLFPSSAEDQIHGKICATLTCVDPTMPSAIPRGVAPWHFGGDGANGAGWCEILSDECKIKVGAGSATGACHLLILAARGSKLCKNA